MRYLSVCSGIEAATVAWQPFGWKAQAFSEIEKFPSAVLAHHYPHIPNLGDMTNYKEWSLDQIDLLVGGTPCQSFSVAGLRKGLADPRGNLCLVYLGLAERFQPRWILWENVPGVLSSGGGRDFGAFLGALAELGYGWAYAVRDAQYFGVPQRRRRVFVVGYLGDWRRAAAVLFERHSLSGNPPPSREKGKETPGDVAACLRSGGNGGVPSSRGKHLVPCVAGTITSSMGRRCGTPNDDNPADYLVTNSIGGDVAPTLDASHNRKWGCDQWVNNGFGVITPIGCHGTQDPCVSQNAFALGRNSGQENVVGFQSSQSGCRVVDAHATLDSNNGSRRHNGVVQGMQVRRLTPVECERLQGFPDTYTNIPWRNKPEAPDGPRYKALGNSMAVPCMRWIGERIQEVDRV